MSNRDFLIDRLGAFPSPWDDKRFMVRSPTAEELEKVPKEYDGLAPYFKSRYYQGDIGDCVGHGASEVMEVTNHLLDMIDDDLSAWDCYEKARKYDGLPDYIEGSNLLGATKALHKLGICTEKCWPTPTSRAANPGKPCPEHKDESLNYGIDSYWQVPVTEGSLKAAIYGLTHRAAYDMPDGSQGKIPLLVAYAVHDSYEEGFDDGVVPRVRPGDRLLGYHASVIRGWKFIDSELYWINQNSWGDDVGDSGIFYLPRDFGIIEGFILHNGPPTGPAPSPCPIGNLAARAANLVPSFLGRRGRFRYVIP